MKALSAPQRRQCVVRLRSGGLAQRVQGHWIVDALLECQGNQMMSALNRLGSALDRAEKEVHGPHSRIERLEGYSHVVSHSVLSIWTFLVVVRLIICPLSRSFFISPFSRFAVLTQVCVCVCECSFLFCIRSWKFEEGLFRKKAPLTVLGLCINVSALSSRFGHVLYSGFVTFLWSATIKTCNISGWSLYHESQSASNSDKQLKRSAAFLLMVCRDAGSSRPHARLRTLFACKAACCRNQSTRLFLSLCLWPASCTREHPRDHLS